LREERAMNCALTSETRREYIRVGSAPASMREKVSKASAQSMSLVLPMLKFSYGSFKKLLLESR